MTPPRRRKANRGALTPRQRDVIELAIQGMTDRETAEALGLATNTVRIHRSAILRRLHSKTMVEAAVKYEREHADEQVREVVWQQLLQAIEASDSLELITPRPKGAAY